jgi:hypothetical protein
MKRIVVFSIILLLLSAPDVLLASRSDYELGYNYAVQFYPRWLSWLQFANKGNRLVGPREVSPEFKRIVAVNDDTLYAGTKLDLRNGPVILTLPAYPNVYSIAQLDVFGDIFHTQLKDIDTKVGGVFALVGPRYKGKLPPGVTKIRFPLNSSLMFVRADKYSKDGDDWIEAAENFRANLQMQSLAAWKKDPTGGKAVIAPQYTFSMPFKRMADEAIEFATESFLETLQDAMASPTTEPLTDSDKALIATFNLRFKAAKDSANGSGLVLADITEGARAAHAALIDRWQSHLDRHNWIHFQNVGHWGKSYLDRAALTEYIQYGNEIKTAYYAHAFIDADGVPLDGSAYSYKIRIPKSTFDDADRFWSITAYTPEDIELVENSLDKYVVASYTPGLVKDADGSAMVYIQANKPQTAPTANWLPVPNGPFNVMLRIYGPTEKVQKGIYLPPQIKRHPYGNQ